MVEKIMMLDNEKRRVIRLTLPKSARRHRGAYALEFAIVFPVFFLLFYGLLTIGMMFAAQQSLTLAAEDGARAALRYFAPAPTGGAFSMMPQLQGRMDHGCDVVTQRTTWLAQVGASAPTCSASVRGPCATADGLPDPASVCTARFDEGGALGSVACGLLPGQQCEATFVVAYPYREHPLVPYVPFVNFVVPQTINGLSTVILDPATLVPLGSGA